MTVVARLNSRWIAVGWLLLVLAVLLAALGRGTVLDTSILTLLPKSEQRPMVQDASDKLAEEFSHRLILLVTASSDVDARSAVKNLAVELERLDAVANVRWRIGDDEAGELKLELYPYRFQLLDLDSRINLQQGDTGLMHDRALIRLFAPVGAGATELIDDPFALHTAYMSQLGSGVNLDLVQGLLKLRNTRSPTYLIELKLAGDPFSPQVQQSILGMLDQAKSELSDRIDSIQVSGMLLHAAAGADQAKAEISTIGLGSLVGILIVMLLVFARSKPLLLVLLPVAIGCLFAASVTLLVFGRVHLITFAFGAGLVGVSIDYTLHFLCERRYSTVDRVLPKILPGLTLGLFSSVMAYAVMLFTPFPGLRQMATFSVAGLFASWITVIVCLPSLTAADTTQKIPLAHRLNRLRHSFPRLVGNPALSVVLAIACLGALVVIWNSSARDDVRLLQTSPAELLLAEKEVQRLLDGSGSAQFILIRGANLEQCLQIEESMSSQLRQLVSDGIIGGYLALSDRLPSLRQQQHNYHLVADLYDQQLESLYTVLQLDDLRRQKADAIFREAGEIRLTAETWQTLSAADIGQGLIVHQAPDSAATVIRFKGNIESVAREAILAITAQQDAAIYVDRIDNLTEILKDYRGQIQTWILLAYALVMMVLMQRYRSQVWRIVAPPILASLLTLAALVQLEQGINLFHLIALILVLGIGLDMGIFMQETAGAASTWLAVSLSALTSLLAFGLLALSNTPVLHHFGITVAIGLSLVWILSPLLRDDSIEADT